MVQSTLKFWTKNFSGYIHPEKIVVILRISAICIFLGRAWQYIVWDAPYREILWSEQIMAPVLNLFGVSWEYWSLHSNPGIILFIQSLGVMYIVCAWSAYKVTAKTSWHFYMVAFGSLNLFLLTYLIYLNKMNTVGMFIEHTLQWSCPLFLLWFLKNDSKKAVFFMKIAIALTFVGHGLYAIGYYQVPGHFVRLVTGTTPISSFDTAVVALKVFGIIDMILAVGIFIPRISLFCLGYCTLWGLLTALARIVGYFSFSDISLSLSTWLHQTIFRMPHGLIPLTCLLIVLLHKKNQENKSLGSA